jgi:hypothetical protein
VAMLGVALFVSPVLALYRKALQLERQAEAVVAAD